MSEYHWTHQHEITFIKCYHQQKKSYKNDLYSRIAELPQNKTIEGQTENIYLVRYHSLIRPFTNGKLSVKKKIQLIRDEKWSKSQQFIHLKVPFIRQNSKMNETKSQSMDRTLSKRTTHHYNASFAHKEETNQ